MHVGFILGRWLEISLNIKINREIGNLYSCRFTGGPLYKLTKSIVDLKHNIETCSKPTDFWFLCFNKITASVTKFNNLDFSLMLASSISFSIDPLPKYKIWWLGKIFHPWPFWCWHCWWLCQISQPVRIIMVILLATLPEIN